jgi:hypothetical protein
VPYVRFSRDKRGYENTYVLHTPQSAGQANPRLLYWFRTPPEVGVGRLALDDDAVRLLEASNPGVTFDWNQILKAWPQTPARSADTSSSAKRRSDQKRPARGGGRGATGRESTPRRRPRDPAPARSPARSDDQFAPPVVADGGEAEPLPSPEPPVVASPAGPPGESEPNVDDHPVVALLGREALLRLRARFAELDAKTASRAGSAAAARESDDPPDPSIRSRLQRLNPDHWGTVEDAVTGIERFDTELDALAVLLG